MNCKLITFILSIIFLNVLFLNIQIATAQEEPVPEEKPLYCHEFLVGKKNSNVSIPGIGNVNLNVNIYPDLYKFCWGMESDKFPMRPESPITEYSIIPNSNKVIENTVCLDDDGKVKSEIEFGTHCGPKPAEENEIAPIDACSNTKDLKGCIASRLPTKSGVTGVAPVSGNLLQNVAKVVNSALGLLGLIFTTFLIYAGIQWIHYGGDADGIKRASKRIKNAIIGLMITLSAYSLSYYILNNLAN